jgi:hypothetical protein
MAKSEEYKIFYSFFLIEQEQRRKEALSLYQNYRYQQLCSNYVHYVKRESKGELIEDTSLDVMLAQLQELKDRLPNHTANITVGTIDNRGKDVSQDGMLYVDWIEYSIAGEDVCKNLAASMSSTAVFKMKNQSTGADGKRYIELYKSLTNEEDL